MNYVLRKARAKLIRDDDRAKQKSSPIAGTRCCKYEWDDYKLLYSYANSHCNGL